MTDGMKWRTTWSITGTAMADRLGNKRSLEGLFLSDCIKSKTYPPRLDKLHTLG